MKPPAVETVKTLLTAPVDVSVSGPIQHLCPYKDETDNGVVTIVWRSESTTFEMHSLSEFLAFWRNKRISHEELADEIFEQLQHLNADGGPNVRSVTARFTTAGLGVEVSRGAVSIHTVGT